MSCVVSTYLYVAFDCMLLSYHVRVSGWICILYFPECQGTPRWKQARYLTFKWQQRGKITDFSDLIPEYHKRNFLLFSSDTVKVLNDDMYHFIGNIWYIISWIPISLPSCLYEKFFNCCSCDKSFGQWVTTLTHHVQ